MILFMYVSGELYKVMARCCLLLMHFFTIQWFQSDEIFKHLSVEILAWLENQRKTNGPEQADFLMEVTAKTLSDIKGGTLVQYRNRLRLLEVAQVGLTVITPPTFAGP